MHVAFGLQGTDMMTCNIDNLRLSHWKNNASKGTDFPTYHSEIKAIDNHDEVVDGILKYIWTPDYKKKINQLIEEMKISPGGFFVARINKNMDDNVKRINIFMKRKAAFLFVFCVSPC